MKIRSIIATVIAIIVMGVFPVVAYAQTTPTAPTDIPVTNLPNDLKDQTTDTPPAAPTENTTPITQRQDFLTGVGVGVVFGIIVGGVLIWFTKK